MGTLFQLLHKHWLVLISTFTLQICVISCVSIWDPFCKEEILYTPYVRVFQKGRPGALLRDRGPGFIDIGGLQDIYVCTNGLVMLYYTKTRGMGEVFEQGELHWAPHHCELYNPSPNNGMQSDYPKKTLLSILLIGHPQDYRRPALQMFVAPMFDFKHGDYINVTSLIMMGTDGECLIEKGAERARLRIRNQLPPSLAALASNDSSAKPPIFCQLDAQRKLGQRGHITLAKPGEAGMKEPLYEFKAPQRSFNGTPFELLHLNDKHPHQKSETGPSIFPRFKATDVSSEPTAHIANEVYAALINDRKMRFVGCLRYPDFSEEQMRIIIAKKNETQELDLTKDGLLIKDSEPPWWAEKVDAPWPESGDTKTNEERYKLYLNVDVSSASVESYEEASKKVMEAETALATAKAEKKEDAEIKKAEEAAQKEKMIFSLWPLKKAYEDLYKYVKELEEQVKKAWEKVYTETFEDMATFTDFKDPESKKAVVVAVWRHLDLVNISQTKYERRYEPYNRELVEQYDQLVNETGYLNVILRQKSIELGPMISNAETLYSRYKVYKNLVKRMISDLQTAIKQMEKTGKPADVVGGDPFDKYFVDTMVEITDATEAPDMNSRACYPLPVQEVTCLMIKPTSARATQLLHNRQGKGKDWAPEDQWREKVLELIEEIFHTVCPYINDDFASSITKIIKGYLLAEPLGTGLIMPIPGSRLEAVDHQYQALVYNNTYNETHMGNDSQPYTGKLRPMQTFWEQIMIALETCKQHAVPMQFWHNEEGDRPPFITYRKYYHNNGTEAHFDVDELMMQEKADMEYSFNWAVEMNWRIFATVLGICMPRYEKTIPFISARFYALYSTDFLHPLRQIWMSNRDNPVLQVILGNYYNRGKGERWAKICMESSFVESGDRNYRPPRNLYVNAFTEMNYFTTGPLAGTSGMLSAVENPF